MSQCFKKSKYLDLILRIHLVILKKRQKILLDKKVNITEKKKLLDSLSYKRILARGYTVIWQKTKVITKCEEIKKLEEFKIEFYDGKIDAKKLINFLFCNLLLFYQIYQIAIIIILIF